MQQELRVLVGDPETGPRCLVLTTTNAYGQRNEWSWEAGPVLGDTVYFGPTEGQM